MRPIVFNIIIVDLFLVIEELHFASYSSNNNIYCSNECASDDITLLHLLSIFFCGSKATKWKGAPIYINWFLAKRVMVKPVWFNISYKYNMRKTDRMKMFRLINNLTFMTMWFLFLTKQTTRTLEKYHIRLLKKEK